MKPTRNGGCSGEKGKAHDDVPMLVFKLADEAYGIDYHRVDEIIRPRPLAAMSSDWARSSGVVDLRGEHIPIVDLRSRFDLSDANTDNARIIVVASDRGRVGIVVDAVTEVTTLRQDDFEDSLALVNDAHAGFTRGVAKRNKDTITLLDIDKALAD